MPRLDGHTPERKRRHHKSMHSARTGQGHDARLKAGKVRTEKQKKPKKRKHMMLSNSQGASVAPAAEPGTEQGHGLDRRLTAVSPFPAR
jgi:hypothetical protein